MKEYNLLMVVICLVVLSSCKKEDQNLSVIEPDFKEFVDRFVTEAYTRNIKIDVSKLKVTYGDTLKYNCGYGMPNDVVIKSSCWENLSESSKEIFIFHEFGHALLGRIHDNSKLPNGDFKTIMHSGQINAYYSEITPERREYYLDELFIPTTPSPGWAAIKTIPTIVFMDTIQSGSPLWQFQNGAGNTFNGKFCSTQYYSRGTSLSIEPSNNLEGWASWKYNYIPQGINQSDKLVLSARIKTVGITKGGGVTLLMRGLDDQ